MYLFKLFSRMVGLPTFFNKLGHVLECIEVALVLKVPPDRIISPRVNHMTYLRRLGQRDTAWSSSQADEDERQAETTQHIRAEAPSHSPLPVELQEVKPVEPHPLERLIHPLPHTHIRVVS